MEVSAHHRKRLPLLAVAFCLALLAAGCANSSKEKEADGNGNGNGHEQNGDGETPRKRAARDKDAEEDGFAFLLSMSWEEARSITAQHLEMPPHCRLAADEIEILKTDAEGNAKRARARGKVFLEMMLEEPVRVLAQEAFVSEDEVILRGKPLLQRGGGVVEGVDDLTVFYFLGSRLKVIGRHRVRQMPEMPDETVKRAIVMGGRGGGGGFADPGPPPALPVRQGPWAGGPNPLLPPLSPDSVPAGVREKMLREAGAIEVTPLFLPVGGSEAPAAPAPETIHGPPSPPTDAGKPASSG